MRRIGLKGERLDDLLDHISRLYGIRANTIKEMYGKKIGFFVCENYYARINSPVSCSILYYQQDKDSCEIEIVTSGGSSGFLAIGWGAEGHMESKVAESIIKHAVKKLNLEKIKDNKERGIKKVGVHIHYPYIRPPDK